MSVSEDLAAGNIKNLAGRVTPDVVTLLTKTVAQLSLKQKTDLKVVFSDIFFSFPYQLGVIFDGSGKNHIPYQYSNAQSHSDSIEAH